MDDEQEQLNSFWYILPHELLCLIIQLIDFIDFHCMSRVCKNWRLTCKDSCPPIPDDPIPWLLTKKSSMDIRIHRPLTNKTYKIEIPELLGTQSHCLYSKDSWLLIYNEINFIHSFVLLNLLTLEKICLPIPFPRNFSVVISRGSFSTDSESKSPNFVIFVSHNAYTQVLHAYKTGSNTWKTILLHPDDCLLTTWLCDDYLCCFFVDRVVVFDTDLNLKISKQSLYWGDCTFKFTESNKELFSVGREEDSDSYKFDQSTMDWVKVNVRILIGFRRTYSCNIGFMVGDQWNQVFLQIKNLKNHGCIIRTKGQQVIVDIDRNNQTWLHFS